jgi:hypothetical protein
VKSILANYQKRKRWRGLLPLSICGVLPLALMGFTVKPALSFGRLSMDLREARGRADTARRLRTFFQTFGEDGPPTESYLRIESALASHIPSSPEATSLYQASLSASRDLELELESIVPGMRQDLGLPLGGLSLHERRLALKGRAGSAQIPSFLAAMHREGHPVCVHACKLSSVESEPGVFDFQLELGVYYLAIPSLEEEIDPVIDP